MANIEIIDEINEGNLFLRKVSKDDISFFYNSLTNKEMTNFLSLGPLNFRAFKKINQKLSKIMG